MLSQQRNPCTGCTYPSNSAQPGDIPYHSPKLHPGPRCSMGMWPWSDRHTDRCAWPIYILHRLQLMRNVKTKYTQVSWHTIPLAPNVFCRAQTGWQEGPQDRRLLASCRYNAATHAGCQLYDGSLGTEPVQPADHAATRRQVHGHAQNVQLQTAALTNDQRRWLLVDSSEQLLDCVTWYAFATPVDNRQHRCNWAKKLAKLKTPNTPFSSVARRAVSSGQQCQNNCGLYITFNDICMSMILRITIAADRPWHCLAALSLVKLCWRH